MARRVEVLCSCSRARRPLLFGNPRPEWMHAVECQLYRRGWGMPLHEPEVGDPVLIDGLPCVVTRVSPLYADGIADFVRL